MIRQRVVPVREVVSKPRASGDDPLVRQLRDITRV